MKQISLLIQSNNQSVRDLYSEVKNYSTDAGFDLYMPEEVIIPANQTKFVSLGIRCEIVKKIYHAYESEKYGVEPENFNVSYYLYPRSSISKTPLRLANSVGIIDAGYRGDLMVALDNRSNEDYVIERGVRLFQICLPTLKSIDKIEFVDKLSETKRGSGGFGSTGK
jgi:dUTP pyrophosphatase